MKIRSGMMIAALMLALPTGAWADGISTGPESQQQVKTDSGKISTEYGDYKSTAYPRRTWAIQYNTVKSRLTTRASSGWTSAYSGNQGHLQDAVSRNSNTVGSFNGWLP